MAKAKTKTKTKAVEKKTTKKAETPKKAKATKKEQTPVLTEAMIEEIQNETSELLENLGASMRFNAAAKRARKNTTNLQKMFKVFRKASVDHWKKED